MRGRLLVAYIVSALLVRPAGAQAPPAPPPSARVTQTSATGPLAPPPVPSPAPYAYEPPTPAVPPPQLPPAVPPPAYEGNGWVAVDTLIWWIQGARLPALLTTSPVGTTAATAGVANTAGVHNLFGLGNVNADYRPGGSFRAGTWLDPEHHYGVEVGFLMLAPQGITFGTAAGSGTAILERPFVNPITGKPAADPIAFPGVVGGAFYGSYTTSSLVGTGIWFRENIANSRNPRDMCALCRACGCDDGCFDPNNPKSFRVDMLLGYRYLREEEHLDTLSRVTNIAVNGFGPPGTVVRRVDSIQTINQFHGMDVGFDSEFRYNRFYIEPMLKAAFGVTSASVGYFGARTVNNVPVPGQGGFLVQASNAGRWPHQTGSILPQLGVNFGYNITDRIRAYAGYTLFYWFHIARAGDALDSNINPNFVNGGPIDKSVAHPVAQYNETNIWVQGANVGLEFRY